MQGPPEGFRPQRAGDRTTPGDPRQPEVKEWQRNTWYGPAPVNENPFDEPEEAPELRDARSDNVNQHTGQFWEMDAGKGYGNAKHKSRKHRGDAGKEEKKKDKKKIRHLGLKITAALAVLAVAVGFVLRYFVFNITQIDVIGGGNLITQSEILRRSGIHKGDSILSLKSEDVEQRITSDWRLQFRYVEKDMPHRVVLAVKEREASCWLTWCGIMYVLDKNRVVMYETERQDVIPADLVKVNGIDVRSGSAVGQTMVFSSARQQVLFHNLFLEMKVLDCVSMVESADLSNPDSILLVTRNGYTVSLGNSENIHAKLRSMKLVQDELMRQGLTGGTIHVSHPETPSWSPPAI